jgi:PIN domain nuclease of toxin-antitoxin system
MNFLLDTHIWIWSLLEPSHLKPKVAQILKDPTNHLWLSPVSTWEFLILVEKGRILMEEDPVGWVDRVFKRIPFQEAPINHRIAVESRLVDLPHQDPVDRFLAATALVYDMTLITADERLSRCKKISVLKNK